MELRFDTAGQRGTNALAFGYPTPFGCCGHFSIVSGEPDQVGIVAVSLFGKLSDIEFAGAAHSSGACVPYVRVVRPDNEFTFWPCVLDEGR